MANTFLPRAAGPLLERLMRVFPVVAVMGARQVGKSTLVRHTPALARHLYLSLDDLDLRLQAQADPHALLQRGERLILDEVQRVPELLLALKRSVDEARVPGRFVLTGSAHLLLHAHLSETLAGRASHLVLWPMTRQEQQGLGRAGLWGELLRASPKDWPSLLQEAEALREDWGTAVARGGFPVPALYLKDWEERQLWFRGYLQTYLERDVPALRAVENLPELRRLLEALALRS
ncbi:ATP-binding protein, partial [Thermus islandicus]|uniref:ATP-binding protein n=1 Tax=Thermus islandicus TaxID=540988 RepID=UPI0003B65DC5